MASETSTEIELKEPPDEVVKTVEIIKQNGEVITKVIDDDSTGT